MSTPLSTTLNVGPIPAWLPAAMLAATLALEVVEVYRQRPVATISPQDCWALCSWSGRAVGAWSEMQCTCEPLPRVTP